MLQYEKRGFSKHQSTNKRVFALTQVCVAFLAGLLFSRWFPQESYTYSHGAIIRGDRLKKLLALLFTGYSLAEGGEHIRQVLQQRGVKASFFFTGDFYRNPAFQTLIKNLKAAGHYLGAHSDAHLLYCCWENRDWLLGRNPWGISAFVGIPAQGGNTPQYPHSVSADKSGWEITGGLNNGRFMPASSKVSKPSA